MKKYKPVELDALPVRESGTDQLHDHLSFGYSEDCGACAQLRNDFTWARFHDSVDRSMWTSAIEPAPPDLSLAG